MIERFCRQAHVSADQNTGGDDPPGTFLVQLAKGARPRLRQRLDGALTRGFDETLPLLVGLAWLVGLAVAVAATYRHTVRPPSQRTFIRRDLKRRMSRTTAVGWSSSRS